MQTNPIAITALWISLVVTSVPVVCMQAMAAPQASENEPELNEQTLQQAIEGSDDENLWEQLEQIRHEPQEKELTEAEMRRRQLLLAKVLYRLGNPPPGHLTAAGEVTDEEGKPLQGVEARITKYGPPVFPPKPGIRRKSANEKAIINHTFKFDAPEFGILRVEFSKDGYYPNVITVRERREGNINADEIKQLLSNKHVEVARTVREGIRVILVKVGETTVLRHGKADLEFTPGGEAVGADLDRLRSADSAKASSGNLTTKIAVNNKDETGQSAVIAISARLDRDKKRIEIAEWQTPQDTTWKLPAECRLTMHSEKDNVGFILHEPVSDVDREVLMLEMRHAPEDGYQAALAITPKIYARLLYGRDMHKGFFFFRDAKGHYGKGTIGRLWLESREEGYILTAELELWLQPDGSRNLEEGPRKKSLRSLRRNDPDKDE